MTITVAPARSEYTANAGQTIFNYTFKIFENTDLNVYVTPAGQECSDSDLTTAYTVSGLGDPTGGSITLNTPTSDGDLVTIVSAVPSERTTDYQNNGDFRPDTVNEDFDRVVSIVKKIEDKVSRSPALPECFQGDKPLKIDPPMVGNSLLFDGEKFVNYKPISTVTIAEDIELIDFSTVVFETLNDLVIRKAIGGFIVTLKEGATVRTLGKLTKNDGQGGFYEITSGLSGGFIDIGDGLQAKYIYDQVNDKNSIANFSSIQDWVDNGEKELLINFPYTLTSNITIPAGRKVTFTKNGSIEMGSFSIVWNGEIEAPRTTIFTWNGSQADSRITGTPETNEWLVDWFGLIADGATDWRAEGKQYAIFKFSSDTKTKVVFTKGFYKTPLDNTRSDVTVRCEQGVIFAGTVHAAINNAGATQPELNPKNVRWEGVLCSLERVGTYFCDGVWIDEIYIKDDEPNSYSGYSAGVHFYQSTKNLSCPKITIENSKSSFGFGLDAGTGEPLPEGCWIGHVEILNSGVTGFYARAKNSRIDSVNVRNYGQNELADVNNIGLPGFQGDTSKTYGYVVDGGENFSVGSVTVVGNGYSSIAGNAIELGAGTTNHELLQSRSAALLGVNVRFGSHKVGSIDTRLSGTHGLNIASGSELECGKLITSYNTNKGIVSSAAKVTGGIFRSEFNGDEGALISGTDCAISYLEAYNNGGGLNNIQLTSPKGKIDKIKTWRPAVNTGGGLYITGTSDGFEYSYESIKEGNASLYAFFASNTDDLTCHSMRVTESTNQAFRIVNLTDSSFNGVKIPDVNSGSSVIGATLTNISFMNCNNSSGVASNIGAASVSEFNSVGMTV